MTTSGRPLLPADTSPDADRVLTEVYRRMPIGRKWRLLGEMYRDARLLHAAGVRLRHPAATDREVVEDWMAVNLGVRLRATTRGPAMENYGLQDLRAVTRVFDRLGIPYALGGSMASSLYGRSRHTRDADVTVEPFPGAEAKLLAELGPDYYVNPAAVEEANRGRSSFNLINTATGFKVDVFVRKDEPFDRTAMTRRRALALPDSPGETIYVHSPEDVLLQKLRWYRLGGEVSEVQWGDVRDLLKTQGPALEHAYLEDWAARVGLADLLARARQEAAA